MLVYDVVSQIPDRQHLIRNILQPVFPAGYIADHPFCGEIGVHLSTNQPGECLRISFAKHQFIKQFTLLTHTVFRYISMPSRWSHSCCIICAMYPLNVWLNKYSEKTGNLDDNLYMLLSIVIVAVLFFLITREKTVRKLFVLFIVINYAAIQFFLSNMLMDILPLQKQNMVYNDATIAAYLIVTALLLPPFALFLYRTVKDYLQSLTSDGIMPEFLFLAVIFALYLVLNALYSAFWVSLRDEYHLAFQTNHLLDYMNEGFK